MTKKRYTAKEREDIIQLRKEGLNYAEIAELTGRTEQAITSAFKKWGEKGLVTLRQHRSRQASNTPQAKKPSLDDFTPREMIKHLYDMGYRIQGGKLVVITIREVNTKDIIKNS